MPTSGRDRASSGCSESSPSPPTVHTVAPTPPTEKVGVVREGGGGPAAKVRAFAHGPLGPAETKKLRPQKRARAYMGTPKFCGRALQVRCRSEGTAVRHYILSQSAAAGAIAPL